MLLCVCVCVSQATEYIFKYIIQSRRLFALATGGQSEEEFRCCVHELFMSIRFFLSQENKITSPVTQTQVCPCVCVFVTVCVRVHVTLTQWLDAVQT